MSSLHVNPVPTHDSSPTAQPLRSYGKVARLLDMRCRTGTRWSRVAHGLALSLSVWLWVPHAVASSEYPKDVQELVDIPCAPSCTLCHRDMTGGYGTVSKPFGLALMSAGLSANDQQSLIDSLLAVGNSGVDSDGDGSGDIAELKAGNDPNSPGGGELCPIEYGCGGRIARRPTHGAIAPLAVLGAAALLWWRRRFTCEVTIRSNR